MVADRYQKNVYQLKPESGEVRALPMDPCHPVSVAFDASVNVLYVVCTENSQYHIQRKTFDGRLDETFYNVPQGASANEEAFRLSPAALPSHHAPLIHSACRLRPSLAGITARYSSCPVSGCRQAIPTVGQTAWTE